MMWSKVKAEVNEQCSIDMIYITFDKALCKGFIVINQNEDQSKLKASLEIEGKEFEIKRAEAQILKEFWNKHGNHYSGILKKLQTAKKMEQKKVTFMGTVYQDTDKLKQVFRNILNATENNQLIQGESKKKLEELIKYHDKYEQKVKDIKGFTVDIHPTYNDTRCFHILKNDGTKEDFSFIKCIAKI